LKNERGFLVLEMLVAGLILTASIAATMYLFRIGAANLERINNSNLLSSKLPQAASLIRGLDVDAQQGSVDLGDGVQLEWRSKLIEKIEPARAGQEGGGLPGPPFELDLFQVDFSLAYEGRLTREYAIHVFKYKAVRSPFNLFP